MPGKAEMSLMSKLLIFLNQDPAHIESIAFLLYRDHSPRSVGKAKAIIKNTIKIGWEIYSKGEEYVLSDSHYQLITDGCGDIIESWGRADVMSFKNVQKRHSAT